MRKHDIPGIALALALLGAVPFVGLSVGISMHPAATEQLLSSLFTYAAIVLSFLGGIHWGFAVDHADEGKNHIALIMYMESVAMALLAWAILFIPETYLRLLAYAFLYAVAWGTDSILYNQRYIPLWYFNLRGIVTPIVVVSMYVAYFSVI